MGGGGTVLLPLWSPQSPHGLISELYAEKIVTDFTNPYSTNKCTVPLLFIALLISSYMFWTNCHHQAANMYITKTYRNKIALQSLHMSKCTDYSKNLVSEML